MTYFRESLPPIKEIAELNIGSRPASRKAGARIEDLRAIPWVFSWAQARVALPGWYGFGSAVARLIEETPDAISELKAMAKSGRSSPPCCQTWAWCWPRPTCRLVPLQHAGAGPQRARTHLEHDPRGVGAHPGGPTASSSAPRHWRTTPRSPARSEIAFRTSTRSNHLQIELIRRVRSPATSKKARSRALHLTINGLAAGLCNAG